MFYLKLVHVKNSYIHFQPNQVADTSKISARNLVAKIQQDQNPIKIYPGLTYKYNRSVDGGADPKIFKDHTYLSHKLIKTLQAQSGVSLEQYDFRLFDGLAEQNSKTSAKQWVLGILSDKSEPQPKLWLNLQFLEFIEFCKIPAKKTTGSLVGRKHWSDIFTLEMFAQSQNPKLQKAAKAMLKKYPPCCQKKFRVLEKRIPTPATRKS
jgi:hypothetical protein